MGRLTALFGIWCMIASGVVMIADGSTAQAETGSHERDVDVAIFDEHEFDEHEFDGHEFDGHEFDEHEFDRVDETWHGATDREQVGHDTIVWIHGGAWMSGRSDIDDALEVVRRIRDDPSYSVDVVEAAYPLAPRATIGEQVEILERQIERLARERPGQRLHLVGHSAGATLALLIDSDQVASIHAIAPVMDLQRWGSGPDLYGMSRDEILSTAVGCAECSSMRRTLSPLWQMRSRAGRAEVWVYGDERDTTVDTEQYVNYVSRARTYGLIVNLEWVDGGHMVDGLDADRLLGNLTSSTSTDGPTDEPDGDTTDVPIEDTTVSDTPTRDTRRIIER